MTDKNDERPVQRIEAGGYELEERPRPLTVDGGWWLRNTIGEGVRLEDHEVKAILQREFMRRFHHGGDYAGQPKRHFLKCLFGGWFWPRCSQCDQFYDECSCFKCCGAADPPFRCVMQKPEKLSEQTAKGMGPMTMNEAREIAAQAWCEPETERKVMDPELSEAFARILVRELQEPRVEAA